MTQGGSQKPRRRLAALEDQRPAPPPPDRTEARRRMKAFPDRLLEAQRGNLGKEEAAEVRATAEAILERGAEMRESRGGPSLMARCAGIKRGGGQCTTVVRPPQTHCYQHDPARSEERRRNASRAGKGAGGREIRGLKRRISEVVDAVLEGSQDRGRAAVAIQGFNALKGVLALERQIREADELEARLEALERASGAQRGGRPWGA